MRFLLFIVIFNFSYSNYCIAQNRPFGEIGNFDFSPDKMITPDMVERKKSGIGYRYGIIKFYARFQDYIYTDDQLASGINDSFPLFIQFNEVKNNYLGSTSYYLNFDNIKLDSIPPVLKGLSYNDLISSSKSNITILSDQTYFSEFLLKYPQYILLSENLKEPSLSADIYGTLTTFGKSFYGYASAIRVRLFGVGLGLGLSYFDGDITVNLCDPYFITSEIDSRDLFSKKRIGKCINKRKIISSKISNFGISATGRVTTLSYIGEVFEFNFASLNGYAAIFNADLPLDATLGSIHQEIFSIVYTF